MSKKTEKLVINKDSKIVQGQTRVDLFDEEIDSFMVEKFEKTDEGYLKGRAIVTNVGVFPYVVLDENGNRVIRRELRPPEQVFDEQSLKTLKMIPVTDKHPAVAVDTENVQELQAGFSGDSVRVDGLHLSVPLNITKPETVDGILRDGNQAISCGYTVDLIEQSGTFLGMDYDAIQTNIGYNHIAVNIQKGRAGDAAVLKLDSYDGHTPLKEEKKEDIKSENKKDNNKEKFNKEETMLKKITIDGVEYEAEAKVIEAMHTAQTKSDDLQSKLDEANNEKEKLQADLDSKNDENVKLKEANEELKNANHDEEIDKAVEAKLQLKAVAEKADVELTEDMSDKDIKKAVIFSAFPNADKEKLDNASDIYLDARYEAACDTISETKKVDEKAKEDGLDIPKNKEDEKPQNSDDAREKMIADEKNAWQKNLEDK